MQGPADASVAAPVADVHAIDLTAVVRRRLWRQAAQFSWFYLSSISLGLVATGTYLVLRASRGSLHHNRAWLAALFALGIVLLAASVWLCSRLGRGDHAAAWTGAILAPLVAALFVALGVSDALAAGRIGSSASGINTTVRVERSISAALHAIAVGAILVPASISVLRTIRLRQRAGSEEATLLSLAFPWRRLRDYFFPGGAGVPRLALALWALALLLAVGSNYFLPAVGSVVLILLAWKRSRGPTFLEVPDSRL